MKLPIYLMIIAAAAGAVSCNSDSDDPVVEDNTDYSNLIVSKFSLQKDDSVLAHLDSVFFSIDLNAGKIYNADSLPRGTKINRLRVSLTLPTVREAELTWRTDEGKDSTISYFTNSSDSIDFSNGPVKLRLKSFDEKAEMTYQISVNVHQMDPDSLYWNRTAVRPLPTSLENPAQSRTIGFKGGALVLTVDDASACVAFCSDPGSDDTWKISSTVLPQGAMISTLSALDDKLYMVADRQLYTSADGGVTWSATGITADYIYGACGDLLVATRRNPGGKYVHFTFPATVETDVPDGCPVRATSLPLVFTTEWATTPMMLMTGGRTADGNLTGDTWGYDNGQWARISLAPMPEGEYITFFPYFTVKTSTTNWTPTTRSALLAILGGKTYVSFDRGIHWRLAEQTLQLPDYIPALYNAQALVFDSHMTVSRGGSVWKELPSAPLAPWYVIDDPLAEMAPSSRADRPITEWDTPYIYIYGGHDTSGRLSTNIWRGVINHLSFKPLQ